MYVTMVVHSYIHDPLTTTSIQETSLQAFLENLKRSLHSIQNNSDHFKSHNSVFPVATCLVSRCISWCVWTRSLLALRLCHSLFKHCTHSCTQNYSRRKQMGETQIHTLNVYSCRSTSNHYIYHKEWYTIVHQCLEDNKSNASELLENCIENVRA